MSTTLRFESAPSGMLRCVGTVIWNETTKSAVLIDPTDDPSTFTDILRDRGLALKMILLTHGHVDHVGGTCSVAREFKLMPKMHPNDRELFQDAPSWGRSFGLDLDPQDLVPDELKDGETIEIEDGFCLKVIHTPGHTPGQVGFYSKELGLVVVGDTLFFGSVGRTDLPGGSQEQLVQSIQTRLYALPDDTIVIPGHGSRTTIGREKRENPYVKAR